MNCVGRLLEANQTALKWPWAPSAQPQNSQEAKKVQTGQGLPQQAYADFPDGTLHFLVPELSSIKIARVHPDVLHARAPHAVSARLLIALWGRQKCWHLPPSIIWAPIGEGDLHVQSLIPVPMSGYRYRPNSAAHRGKLGSAMQTHSFIPTRWWQAAKFLTKSPTLGGWKDRVPALRTQQRPVFGFQEGWMLFQSPCSLLCWANWLYLQCLFPALLSPGPSSCSLHCLAKGKLWAIGETFSSGRGELALPLPPCCLQHLLSCLLKPLTSHLALFYSLRLGHQGWSSHLGMKACWMMLRNGRWEHMVQPIASAESDTRPSEGLWGVRGCLMAKKPRFKTCYLWVITKANM